MKPVRAAELGALISAVRRDLTPYPPLPLAMLGAGSTGRGGTLKLYLVGATSHLAEGWRDQVARLELAGDSRIAAVVREAAAGLGVDLTWESPADVIPIPAGADQRARPVPADIGGAGEPLAVLHFDPYSVILRLVARGDEQDYVDSLEYLRRGWVEQEQLEAMLALVLPRFTNETLAQDPAEFRRKFRGLRQLHLSEVAHRHLA
jgi:hypothetical protein